MSKSKIVLIAYLIFFLLGLCLAQDVAAEENAPNISNAGVLFLLVSNSPRANGMGGCMLNTVDEESPLHNPGTLGLFHMDRIFSVSFPHKTDWLPALDNDMKLETFNLSGGFSTKILSPESDHHISIGFGYGEHKVDYGEIMITDIAGNVLDIIYPAETAKYYSVGLGIDYYARLGIGISNKKIKSDLPSPQGGKVSAEADAIDFGMLIEFPLADIIRKTVPSDPLNKSDYGLKLTPSLAYVYTNNGDSIKYLDASNPDPLPEKKKMGIGLYGAFTYLDQNAFSIKLAWERHRWQIGKPYKTYNQGLEIGVFDASYIRFGAHSDAEGGVSYDTFGLGFSIQGILHLLLMNKPDPESDILHYLMTHVDFTIDYAKYSGVDSPLDETTFTSICLSF